MFFRRNEMMYLHFRKIIQLILLSLGLLLWRFSLLWRIVFSYKVYRRTKNVSSNNMGAFFQKRKGWRWSYYCTDNTNFLSNSYHGWKLKKKIKCLSCTCYIRVFYFFWKLEIFESSLRWTAIKITFELSNHIDINRLSPKL